MDSGAGEDYPSRSAEIILHHLSILSYFSLYHINGFGFEIIHAYIVFFNSLFYSCFNGKIYLVDLSYNHIYKF